MRYTNSSNGTKDRARHLQLAVSHFLDIPGTLTADRLNLFYQKAQYWCGTRRAGSELAIRTQEKNDLLAFTQKLDDSEALAFYEHLRPWADTDIFMLDADTAAIKIALRNELADLLQQRIEVQLVAFITTQDFVRKLGEKNRYVVFKHLLFPPDEWLANIRNALVEISDRGMLDDIAYNNVDDLAKLWMDILNHRSGDLGVSHLAAFLKDGDVLEKLWSVLISRELMPRGWIRLLAVREKLIEAGAKPEFLPLDERLNVHLEVFTAQRDDIMRSV